MSSRVEMVNHGIHTSKAEVWVHLSPFEYRLYWYLSRHMLDYLKRSKIAAAIGRSKDGVVSADGIPVPVGLPFIKPVQIPKHFIDFFGGWSPQEMNDRDAGFNAETIVDWLIPLGYLTFHPYRLEPIRKRSEQISNFGDFELAFAPRVRIEVKADRKISETGNLYVQIGERGHRPCLLRTSEGVVEHVTPLPRLRP